MKAPAQGPAHERLLMPAAQPQSRLILVDFARVIAILFMIQGHTLDVLLAPAYRQGDLFASWLFLRGLTAPMFFVLSGVSFTLSSVKRWDSYLRPSAPLFRRLGRFVFFILLGYAMHFPVKSFDNFKYLDAAGWQGWLQVDVLQCIGFTLVFLQILLWLAGTPRRFATAALGMSAAIVCFAPVAWKMDWTRHLPLSVAPYFNARTGSLFPLLPWSGYVLFGAALGYVFLQWRSDFDARAMRPLAGGGVLLILLGLCCSVFPVTLYANLDFWKVSPNLFLIRVGAVCFSLALLVYLTRRIRIPQQATRSLAQESLIIYFFHVCILYGSIWNVGLRQRIGANLTLLPTMGYIAAMVASMALLGWLWNWSKRSSPASSFLVRTAVIVFAITHRMN